MEHTKDPSKDNVILIGMPGVGKSTAGVILAKVLGYDFLDSDLVIQKQTKKRLSEIIAAEGIDGFNALENRINSEITVSHPTVIATGGSVIYGADAWPISSDRHHRLSENQLQGTDPQAGGSGRRGVVTQKRTDAGRSVPGAVCPL